MGFSGQKYWSGLPCSPPGDLPKPGIEPASLGLLHWKTGSLPLAPPAANSFKLLMSYFTLFFLALCFTASDFCLHYTDLNLEKSQVLKSHSGPPNWVPKPGRRRTMLWIRHKNFRPWTDFHLSFRHFFNSHQNHLVTLLWPDLTLGEANSVWPSS